MAGTLGGAKACLFPKSASRFKGALCRIHLHSTVHLPFVFLRKGVFTIMNYLLPKRPLTPLFLITPSAPQPATLVEDFCWELDRNDQLRICSCKFLLSIKGRIWSKTYFPRFKEIEEDFLGTSDSGRIPWISNVVVYYS